MALRKEKLETFRRQLTQRRDTLSQGLHTAAQEFFNDDASYADSVDQAAADSDKTVAMQMKNRDHFTVLQIDQALRRIEDGNFGTCQRCSEDIAEARIKAFPFTTLCIDCKSEIESEESRFPGRV
jgi:DnaK suppressor protein